MRTLLNVCGVAMLLAGCQPYDPIIRPDELYTEEQKAAMSTEEKVEAYNEQLEEGDRLHCRREARTGSHRHRTVCRTLKEMHDETARAQEDLETFQRERHTLPPADGT